MTRITPGNLAGVILTLTITVVIILTTIFSLKNEITDIFPFFYLLPIIILAITQPRFAIYFTIILGWIYLGLVYIYGPVDLRLYATSTAWFYIFVTIGVFVSSFANKLSQERKFRDIFTYSQAGIFTFNTISGKILEINEKATRMLGYELEEITAIRISQIFHEKETEERFLARLAAEKQIGDFEVAFRRKDETTLWVLLAAFLNRDLTATCSIMDITDRKNAEEVLHESEERYRLLLQNINDGVIVHEVSVAGPGKIIEVNDRTCRMLGYTREELLQRSITDLDVPEQLAKSSGIAQKLFATKHAVFSTDFLNREGHRIPTEISVRLFDLQGQSTALTVIRDITERKQAEEVLKLSERRMTDIINFLPDATFVIDNSGCIIAWNKAMEEMTGTPAAVMLGKGNFEYSIPFYGERSPMLVDLVCKKDEETEKKYSRIQKTGDNIIAELYLPTFYGGKSAYLWGAASPLYDTIGNVVGAIESIRDITDRKRAEELIQQSLANWLVTFNAINDSVCLLDPQGTIQICNNRMQAFLSKPEEEIIGQKCFDLLHCTGSMVQECPFEKMVRSKKRETLEIEVDGNWYIESADPVTDERGEITGAIQILHDVTSGKKMEVALRQSEAQLKSFIHGSPLPQFVIDRDHRVVSWNRALEELTGIDAMTVFEKNTWRAFYKAERPVLADLLVDEKSENISEWYNGKCRKSRVVEGAYEATDFFPDLGDSGRWLFFTAAPIRDANGAIAGAVETLEDITERKKMEEALRESEEKFRTIASFTTDWEYWLDPDKKFRYTSPSCETVTGYSVQEFMDDDNLLNAIVHPDDKPLVEDHILKCWNNPGPDNVDFRIIRKDGAVRWIGHRCRQVISDQGATLGRRVSNRDITDRKTMENAIRESEENYRGIFENIQDIFYRADENGKLIMVSPSGIRAFGCESAEDLLGKDIATTFYSDPHERNRLLEAFEGKESIRNFILNLKRRDSTPLIFSVNAHRYYNKDGQYQGMEGILTDITEWKKAEENLRESEKRYHNLAETVPDQIFIIGRDDTLEYANKASLELLRLPLDKVIGAARKDLFPPEIVKGQEPLLKNVFETGEITRAEKELQFGADGIWIDTILVPLKDETGRVDKVLGVARDVTHRKEMEEALLRSMEEKEIMIKEIHHRVRNNLQIMESMISLQARTIHDPAVLHEITKMKMRIAAMALVHDIAYDHETPDSIGIKHLISRIASRIIDTSVQKKCKIDVNTAVQDIDMPLTKSVPFTIILTELLMNSVQHAFLGRDSGFITIEFLYNENNYTLGYCDSGIGFPKDKSPDMADTGGLFLIRGLVEQLRGAIEYPAWPETQLTITFPRNGLVTKT